MKEYLKEKLNIKSPSEEYLKMMGVEPKTRVRSQGEKGDQYIEGNYRIWMDPKGGIRIKLDRQEIFYISKKSDLYHELKGKMFKGE